jgi:tetratricopeptide (TPR) repeat protein
MTRQKWIHVDSPAAVGDRLRTARERAGLSQRQLAFDGCSAAYISRVEHGERVPSLQLMRELGRRLGVSADWLATGEELECPVDSLVEAELALRLDDHEAAEHLFTEALGSDDRAVRGRALGGLGELAFRRGDLQDAVRQLEEARELLGDAAVAQPAIVESLGKAYAIRGELELSIGVFEWAADRATADELAQARYRLLLANALLDSGNFGRAEELLGGVVARMSESADPIFLARLYWSQSRLHSVRGEQDLAARYARRALAAVELTEHAQYAARAHHLLAYIELERGNAEEALDLLERGLPLIHQSGDRFLEGLFGLEQARALLKLGRTEEAHEKATEASGVLTATSRIDAVRCYALLADLFAETGERERAIELYELAAGSLGDAQTPLLFDVHARWAELLEQEGRQDEALDVLKRAVQYRTGATRGAR